MKVSCRESGFLNSLHKCLFLVLVQISMYFAAEMSPHQALNIQQQTYILAVLFQNTVQQTQTPPCLGAVTYPFRPFPLPASSMASLCPDWGPRRLCQLNFLSMSEHTGQ